MRNAPIIKRIKESCIFETYPHTPLEAQIIDLVRSGIMVKAQDPQVSLALYSLQSKGIIINEGTRMFPEWTLVKDI